MQKAKLPGSLNSINQRLHSGKLWSVLDVPQNFGTFNRNDAYRPCPITYFSLLLSDTNDRKSKASEYTENRHK